MKIYYLLLNKTNYQFHEIYPCTPGWHQTRSPISREQCSLHLLLITLPRKNTFTDSLRISVVEFCETSCYLVYLISVCVWSIVSKNKIHSSRIMMLTLRIKTCQILYFFSFCKILIFFFYFTSIFMGEGEIIV